MIGAKVPLAKVVGRDGVQLRGEHGQVGVLGHDPLGRVGRAEQVDEDYMLLKLKVCLFCFISHFPLMSRSESF